MGGAPIISINKRKTEEMLQQFEYRDFNHESVIKIEQRYDLKFKMRDDLANKLPSSGIQAIEVMRSKLPNDLIPVIPGVYYDTVIVLFQPNEENKGTKIYATFGLNVLDSKDDRAVIQIQEYDQNAITVIHNGKEVNIGKYPPTIS